MPEECMFRAFFIIDHSMQLELIDTAIETCKPQIELWELFASYYNCRANKRNTINAIAFEVDYEYNLIQLCHEINNGSYQPGRSIAFIVYKPVTREIFTADFRDRVVHHLIIKKLNRLFEKDFIFDSYACRPAKGTHFGIRRVNNFIRKCSKNYTTDCYILKLDVQGFLVHINRELLFNWLQQFIDNPKRAKCR
jgi:RNA-directed DNA polymerase